ncbi:TauD/TfdA dioxygenase family protein [Pelagibius marinus]|uniref:TauD/TfdA dioxygenase family protein n=1 Tax=Pelagibius marinus TaxID=2762760 RepID=UPI001872F141|nr:TauD/TfdA family dioxygenase [Pelagibius marinus]
MKVVPSGAALGAEVQGVDLAAPLDSATVEQIKAAWDAHLVLVFRGQQMSDPDLLAFSRNFGELDPPGPNPYGVTFLPEFPEINVISNVKDAENRPIGNLGAGEAVWHADMTYIETPPKAAILHALEIPVGQGDTYFANMVAAYEDLPADLKAAIEGRSAIHDAAHNSAGMLRKGYEEISDPRQTPGAHHPLVRQDPATGRRALFLGRRPHAYVPGLEPAESDALLDRLWAHATQPKYTWAHQWRPGDLLMWQNLWILHRRDGFEETARRILHRTQIKGDEAIVA